MLNRFATSVSILLCFCIPALAEPDKKPKPTIKITEWKILLNGPLGDAEIKQIKETKDWQKKTVVLYDQTPEGTMESLAKLPEIEHLTLSRVKGLQSFKAVRPLKGLQSLKVTMPTFPMCEFVFDCVDLAMLTELNTIRLSSVKLKNVAALKACTKLTAVDFSSSLVDSLDFAIGTPDLEKLDLYGFQHSFPSYKPLTRLKKLKFLNVYMNQQAADEKLSVLSGLTSLERFEMGNCKAVTTVNFLANCKGFKKLEAAFCERLTDISALAGMTKLEEVNLRGTGVTDIKPLAGCRNIERLSLEDTKVEDLSMLAGLNNLTHLNLTGTPVTDLSPLAKCEALQTLTLNRSKVVDLKPLAGHPELTRLEIEGCQITDLAPLAQCPDLVVLVMNNCKATDLKPLYKSKSLTHIEVSQTFDQAEIDALKKALPKCRVAK